MPQYASRGRRLRIGHALGARSGVGKRHFQVYPRSGSLRAAASPLTVTRSRVPMGIEAQWWAGPACHRQRCASQL
jgi:hypothetical protein